MTMMFERCDPDELHQALDFVNAGFHVDHILKLALKTLSFGLYAG